MSSTSAVFVGGGTLLVRCAQAWREAGHTVAFVATRNAEIAQWARGKGIAHGDPSEIPDIAFDYLFSVANLEVLDMRLVRRAAKLAINFHDGPLPRYAGLNATSWAILAGEATHGGAWRGGAGRGGAGRGGGRGRGPGAGGGAARGLN